MGGKTDEQNHLQPGSWGLFCADGQAEDEVDGGKGGDHHL